MIEHPEIDWLPPLVPCRKPPTKVYLRFGLWESRSYNHATNTPERGVSVYPARLNGDVVEFDWDDREICWGDFAPLEGRMVWALTGKEVCRGSDGEPVIQAAVARPFAVSHEVYAEVRKDARMRK